jgi:hypothetical protein
MAQKSGAIAFTVGRCGFILPKINSAHLGRASDRVATTSSETGPLSYHPIMSAFSLAVLLDGRWRCHGRFQNKAGSASSCSAENNSCSRAATFDEKSMLPNKTARLNF